MGRPRKTEPRDRQLNLSLTAVELAGIERRAQALGMRPVHFGRALLLDTARQPSRKTVEANPVQRLIYGQLQRLGNNLNQLMRHLHQTGDPLPRDLEPLLTDIRQIIAKMPGMIVRILSSGTSFKGLSDYLTHDPDAETSGRVAFTHTHNLANDHVPSAVNEMVWTARDAELLKQEAGIRAGGRETEQTVKHVSLNWAPGQAPTREHMIASGEDFLRHMQWQEHQAIFVAHSDKAHSHLHLMVNAVHPETGLKLDDSFEKRRAQAWALEYEREHGMIYCEQRLMRPEEREAAMTREAWLAFQEQEKQFRTAEENRRNSSARTDSENPENGSNAEWKILKDLQRREREGFFAGGKAAFSEARQNAYRETREEFRERWSGYYAARREGGDAGALAEMKAGLLSDQKEALGLRCDQACEALRATRDADYRDLLDDQRDIRHALKARQDAGLDNATFLHLVDDRTITTNLGFREAAAETSSPGVAAPDPIPTEERADTEDGPSITRPAADMGRDVGIGIGAGLLKFFGGFLVDFVNNNGPTPREPAPDPFEAAAEEAGKRQQRERFEEAERDWRDKERDRVWD